VQMQDCVGMGTQEEVVGFWVVVVVVFMVVVGVQVWRKKSVFNFGSRLEAAQVGRCARWGERVGMYLRRRL
jgi:hypothetical protein